MWWCPSWISNDNSHWLPVLICASCSRCSIGGAYCTEFLYLERNVGDVNKSKAAEIKLHRYWFWLDCQSSFVEKSPKDSIFPPPTCRLRAYEIYSRTFDLYRTGMIVITIWFKDVIAILNPVAQRSGMWSKNDYASKSFSLIILHTSLYCIL
jgi:hypothetical protein